MSKRMLFWLLRAVVFGNTQNNNNKNKLGTSLHHILYNNKLHNMSSKTDAHDSKNKRPPHPVCRSERLNKKQCTAEENNTDNNTPNKNTNDNRHTFSINHNDTNRNKKNINHHHQNNNNVTNINTKEKNNKEKLFEICNILGIDGKILEMPQNGFTSTACETGARALSRATHIIKNITARVCDLVSPSNESLKTTIMKENIYNSELKNLIANSFKQVFLEIKIHLLLSKVY